MPPIVHFDNYLAQLNICDMLHSATIDISLEVITLKKIVLACHPTTSNEMVPISLEVYNPQENRYYHGSFKYFLGGCLPPRKAIYLWIEMFLCRFGKLDVALISFAVSLQGNDL